jgi:enoyl-CoA hydratase/carnithine racemase
MTTDKMLAEKRGAIGIMTFNNPERHNAVSFDMWEAAARILEDFRTDPAIRVVVLTGAGGKAFVSGADISKFGDERATSEAQARYNVATEAIYAGLHAFPKPTLAMIRGFCIGGGLGVAMSCDIRFCNDKAKFALPAARLGLGYGFPGLKRFIDAIGPSATKDIFFTARQLDAAEAHRLGIINQVLPDAELEAHVIAYAETIAANAPLTVTAIKQITTEVLKPESERDLARCKALVAECFASADYIEGRTAFMEKRKPAFKGR